MLRADGRCGLDILLGGNARSAMRSPGEVKATPSFSAKFQCRVGRTRLIHSAELARSSSFAKSSHVCASSWNLVVAPWIW